MYHVVIIHANEAIKHSITETLDQTANEIDYMVVDTLDEASESSHPCDVVIVDERSPKRIWLTQVRSVWRLRPVIVVGQQANEGIGWIKAGAADYITLDLLDRLPLSIARAHRHLQNSQRMNDTLEHLQRQYTLANDLVSQRTLHDLLMAYVQIVFERAAGTADLLRVSDDVMEVVATVGEPLEAVSFSIDPSQTPDELVGLRVTAFDLTPHIDWNHPHPFVARLRKRRTQTVLIVPLPSLDERTMVVLLTWNTPHTLNTRERYLLRTLRPQFSALVHHMAQLEETQLSQSRFMALAETTTAAIFLVREGIITYSNRAAEQLTGYETLVGHAIDDFIDLEALPEQSRTSPALHRQAEPYPAIEIKTQDGSPLLVEARWGSFDGGKTDIITAFDVTEREMASHLLEDIYESYRRLVSNSPYMIVQWNKHTLNKISESVNEMIGYSLADLQNMAHHIRSCVLEDDRPLFDELEATRHKRTEIIRVRHRDGHTVHLEFRVMPIDNGGMEAIVRDLTVNMVAERNLRNLTDQLTATEDKARRQFAQDIHDVALSNLSMCLWDIDDLLAQETAVEALGPVREALNTEIQRLRGIMENLYPITLETQGLEAALLEMCQMFRRSNRVVIETHLKEADQRLGPRVELAIYLVVKESLTNAIKHAEASTIKVTVEVSDSMVYGKVCDDGTGFDQNHYDHKGVGLVSMRERIYQSDGTFTVDTTPGHGTCIIFSLPWGVETNARSSN